MKAGILVFFSIFISSIAYAGTNLLANSGFEKPENGMGLKPAEWSFYATGRGQVVIVTTEAKEGVQSLALCAQRKPNTGMGIFKILPIQPEAKYDFSVYVRNDREELLGGDAFGQMVVEWCNAAGREISRCTSGRWDKNTSRMSWRKISMEKIRPPKGAVQAKFGIHLYDGPGGGSGRFLVDEVQLIIR